MLSRAGLLRCSAVLDGARGTLLFYGPSQLKQIFVELMMLARRPRPNSPAWHEFFSHARIYPNHCVFNLDQHGCGLNASTWPRFTGNKTWEGGDDFVPHVFELQLRPELRPRSCSRSCGRSCGWNSAAALQLQLQLQLRRGAASLRPAASLRRDAS